MEVTFCPCADLAPPPPWQRNVYKKPTSIIISCILYLCDMESTSEDTTVLHKILRNLKKYPDSLALSWWGGGTPLQSSFTYGQLDHRSKDVAVGLLETFREAKWSSKEVVLCFSDGPEFVLSFLGCLRAGLIPGTVLWLLYSEVPL